jgi:hypothetical protein
VRSLSFVIAISFGGVLLETRKTRTTGDDNVNNLKFNSWDLGAYVCFDEFDFDSKAKPLPACKD